MTHMQIHASQRNELQVPTHTLRILAFDVHRASCLISLHHAFPDCQVHLVLQELPPKAGNELAAALLVTRAGSEDQGLRQKLTTHRWLPDVLPQLQQDCRCNAADDRGRALIRVLQTAVNSRHSLTEVTMTSTATYRNLKQIFAPVNVLRGSTSPAQFVECVSTVAVRCNAESSQA